VNIPLRLLVASATPRWQRSSIDTDTSYPDWMLVLQPPSIVFELLRLLKPIGPTLLV